MNNLINNQIINLINNWCDIKQYHVKELKLSMFHLMTSVNCLNVNNNYSDNYSAISKHIHTVYMTYSVTSTLYM